MQGQDSSHRFGRLFRRRPEGALPLEGVARVGTLIEEPDEARPLSENAQAGDRIAGYLVEAPIGRGGMGVVYRAFHLHLGRPVALKLLPPAVADDERFRTRFVQESRLAASLLHPNIVTIFDAGEERGRLYIAMQYVPGGDLGHAVDVEGALEPSRVVHLLSQVAAALDTAHQAGLVHRDVKPANILVDGTRALLTDFGLTKRMTGDTGLTKGGQIVGTVDYLAPEQIESLPLDGRADQYALGAVAYHLLAGRAPFADRSELALLKAHLREDPRPLAGDRPGVTPRMDAAIARAMAKRPDDRYPTCTAFVADLAGVTGEPLPVAAPEPPPAQSRVPVVLLAGHDEGGAAGLRSALAVGSHRVAEAKDCDSALALAREAPPDVAVVGWSACGSVDFCRELKEISPAVRLIAVVNRAESSDRRMLFGQGADEVLTRPVSPIRLLTTVRMLLASEEMPA